MPAHGEIIMHVCIGSCVRRRIGADSKCCAGKASIEKGMDSVVQLAVSTYSVPADENRHCAFAHLIHVILGPEHA